MYVYMYAYISVWYITKMCQRIELKRKSSKIECDQKKLYLNVEIIGKAQIHK